MVVQHNLNAVDFIRRAEAVSSLQFKSVEKVSLENNINNKEDDAVGLSISGKVKNQLKDLEYSATNAQESVSSVQKMEEGLSEVYNKLERMREYAVEASDETKSKEDRDRIQSEIAQLSAEIDQIAETTKFNGKDLLNGTDAMTRQYPKAQDAGLEGKLTDEETKATFEMSKLAPEDEVVVGGKEYTIGYPSIAYGNNTDYAALATDYEQEEYNARTQKNKYRFGTDEYNEWDRREAFCRSRKFECKKLEQTNNTVISEEEAYDRIQKELTDANNIGTTAQSSVVTRSVDEEKNIVTFSIEKGYAEVNEPLNVALHAGSDADKENEISVEVEAMKTANLGLKGLDVSGETGRAATYAIDAITNALTKVSEQSAKLDEAKGKVEDSITSLDNEVESKTKEMANEMIEKAMKNILAQANQAMVAQANQMTQSVQLLLQ